MSTSSTPVYAMDPAPIIVGLAPPPSVPAFPVARALYPFAANSPQELSFNPGDVLTIHNQDGAWWHAELNGTYGLVPSNYVQLC